MFSMLRGDEGMVACGRLRPWPFRSPVQPRPLRGVRVASAPAIPSAGV